MASDRTNVILRSAALFTAIGAAQVHLHELGHLVTAIALHLRPIVLYPTAVFTPAAPHNLSRVALVATAGPVTSLLIALVAYLAYRARRDRARPEERLALAWTIYHGAASSLGYLITTPLAGDTHNVALIVGLPRAAQWLASGIGLFAMTRVAPLLLPVLAAVAPSGDRLATPRDRARWVTDVALLPWLVLLVLGAVLGWEFSSVVGFGAFGIPLIVARSDAQKRDDLETDGRAWGTGPLAWIGLVIFAAFAALDALVLKHGLVVVR